ncbi:glutamine synthetase [Bifidobacterium bifidum]|nr:glutamine synthetase [Bifidobacterium bifidum]
MDKQQEFALRTVEERDVRFIRLWFTDVLGTLKSVAIAPAELEAAFEEGLGFDGSAIEGMTRVSEDDMIVQPDPSTFQILPWRGGPQGTARMFCDILTPDGEPSLGDPRHVLKRALAKAKEKGFTFYVHPEIEFYLFENQTDWSKAPTPIDEGGYFDHVPRSPGMDFRRATVNMLEQMGISVEYSHHEAGPGQNEIDLRYADALTTADNIMTFRTVVKEISLERGIHASFMPKPLADAPGSGMHTHLSLFEGDSNAFYEAGQEFNMSLTARQFAAGILHHAAEICAVTDQFVNSYKRLWGGAEAPSYICWGHNNRSALLRIPQYKPGKGQLRAYGVPWTRPGGEPVSGVFGAARRRSGRHRTADDAGRADQRRRVGADRRRTSGDGHRAAAGFAGRRTEDHGEVRFRRGRARRACVRVFPAQQASGMGRIPWPGHAVRVEEVPAQALT